MNNNTYLKEAKKNLENYATRLSEIQRSFKDESKKDTHNLSQSLKNILQKAEEAYKKLESASDKEWESVKGQAEEAFEDVKGAFNNASSSSVEQVKAYANQVEEFSQETLDTAGEYIKGNPFKSVLLAAGLGYIFGRIFK